MTRKQFADACGVSPQTVTNWIAAGVIPPEMLTVKPYGLRGHLVEIDPAAVDVIVAIRAEREARE
jgi:predicted site-specific integrase-resolvase